MLPHILGGNLSIDLQLLHVQSRDDSVFHADDAVNDDGIDIVANATLHQALDRIADRP